MKFSIITASFNQAPFLPHSLASVQAQTYRNFEHILHDGMSSDGSQDILREYAQGKSNVRLVIEKDDGQVQAINRGLCEAAGDVLMWLNTDDFLFDPQVLERVAKAFEDPSAEVVYGRGWYVDDKRQRVRDVYVKPRISGPTDLVASIGVFQPALYFRRRVLERIGGLSPAYQLTLDYEYWVRMLQAGVQFRFLDAQLAKATLHEDSKTVGSRGRQLVETMLLMKHRYGFVHPDWIHRFANYTLHHADWTSKAGREAEVAAPRLNKLAPDHDLCFFTDEPPSRLARTTPRGRPDATSAPVRRVIVTSFDANYFAQGLNLIASLHVHARHHVDRIVVYDLGLTQAQRGLLELCEGTVLEAYKGDEPWAGYFSPKSYMYKCHAIYDARKHADPLGGEVLWIDAGVCLTGPLDALFDRIRAQGIFLINHDDRRSRTMVNAAFTHPLQVEFLALDARELAEDHICSCVLGYRLGTSGESLVAQASQLALRADINWPTKHPDPKWQRSQLLDQPFETVQRLQNPSLRQREGLARVADYPYYGHRQDQSLFSNLAARMSLPVSSALTYCPATDYSSRVSYENWKSGGEAADIERATTLPRDHRAPLFHHRGTYSNLAGLLTDRSQFVNGDIAFVLGNGPSLKALPFTRLRNVATVGMNAAYRYWDEHGWYPSYYCCMDTVVIMSHAEAIHRLITNAERYGIRYFFLRKVITERYPELADHPRVLFLEDIRPLCPLFQLEPITTGSYSLMLMAFLGFRQIYLSGIDCNYVERINGIADGDKKNKLVVVADVKNNPNYFFDSYQRPGDEYNVPNPSKDLHVRSWRNCAVALATQRDRIGPVRVINLNQQSKVDCFENGSVPRALQVIDTIALSLAKGFARTFGTGQRTPLIDDLQRVLARSLGSTPAVFRPDDAQPQAAEVALRHVKASPGRWELRLLDDVRLARGEVLTAVLEFTAMQGLELTINVLHADAWDGGHRLTVRTASASNPLAQSGPSGLYVADLEQGRHLLLLSLGARRSVRFDGLAIEQISDGSCLADVASRMVVLSIGVHRLRQADADAGAALVPAETASAAPSSCVAPVAPPEFAAAAPTQRPGAGTGFSQALQDFRAGRYAQARATAQTLANGHSGFKWYGELVKACDRELRSQRKVNPF